MSFLHCSFFCVTFSIFLRPYSQKVKADIASEIVNIHLADSNRKSLGRGQTDWLKIFEAIREIDYTSPLVCEPLPPMGNVYDSQKGTRPEADLYAKECMDYLKSIMNQVGLK